MSVIQPRIFTLENVYAYRGSRSWLTLQDALFLAGYWVSIEHVNFADFGVPQTRKRMIVRAVRGGWIPYLPQAERWVSWYEAIEDLIPTLPKSHLAPWQLVLMPSEWRTVLLGNQRNGNERDRVNQAAKNDPAMTMTVANASKLRAFIVDTYTKNTALSDGRVVSMTPRALARIQSFPDWYQLDDINNTLAARGIGNAVPPLGAQRIYEGLKEPRP